MDNSDISRAFNDFVNMLKDFGGAAKLYGLIKAEETKKQELYYRLGKKYYSLFRDCPEKDLRPIVEKLIACDEKIAGFKEELKDSGKDYRDVEEDTGDEKEPGKQASEEAGEKTVTDEPKKTAETAEEIRKDAEETAEETRKDPAETVDEIRESAEELRREISGE